MVVCYIRGGWLQFFLFAMFTLYQCWVSPNLASSEPGTKQLLRTDRPPHIWRKINLANFWLSFVCFCLGNEGRATEQGSVHMIRKPGQGIYIFVLVNIIWSWNHSKKWWCATTVSSLLSLGSNILKFVHRQTNTTTALLDLSNFIKIRTTQTFPILCNIVNNFWNTK